MRTTTPKTDNVATLRRIKKEIVFEYVPILGDVLGYWRRVETNKIGETIEIHLAHTLSDYDRLFINGIEIDITPVLLEKSNLK